MICLLKITWFKTNKIEGLNSLHSD